MKKTLQRLVATGALTIGMLGLAASPALAAAPPTARQGDDYATYDGTTLTVCDRERDGHGVYAEYLLGTGLDRLSDGNGSAPPCGSERISGIQKFRVCEDVAGPNYCSDYVKV